ncbi:hypothetical protein Q5P01_011433 [Channa striata]|uniref:FHA domain-containing protein n=1 Tax=Channa striata TaxID=64152 RepID=A0AA88MUA6_CHASR|nr:hypothetical protein Q5P01_011433 [Channa striata]
MDATQMISDSILESDDEESEQENENKKGRPLAKLQILKNPHIPETEFPLFVGENVLGRDPNSCSLPLPASSISKQHATIGISVYRRRGSESEVDIETLIWDLGSMNGTRKGRIKLTPNVRYALSDGDSLVVADIPCQYVSCAVNTDLSQEDTRTPVSRNLGLGVNARLPDASGEKSCVTSTGSKKCVNRGLKARMSLTRSPVKVSCLSFEQTPTQPQRTLVPESDSDSDNERRGGGARGRKALVSDSDSHKSSPACSTFLSPTNKIVPESEDESPITPSSSTKNRPHRDVSLNKEEIDINVGQQQQLKKQPLTIVDESEKDQGKKEERILPGGTESCKNGQHAAAQQEMNVSLTGDELPVPTPEVSAHAVPVFNMESDTDTEGEEKGVAFPSPVTLGQVTHPPNTDQFHMDSDTDDEDAIDEVLKTVSSSSENTKPPHVLVLQPEGVTMDSDTDVDDDSAVSDAVTEAKPMSFQSTHIADSSTQPKDFYLDSDTDADEEIKGGEYGKSKPSSKIDACQTRLDEKSVAPKSTPTLPRLNPDSDTDDEAIPTLTLSKPKTVFAATESSSTADAGAELNIRPDSDTDVDDDSPLVIPVAVTNLSVSPANVSDAPLSDDANTDVDEASVPSARDVDSQANRSVDNGTKVENDEADVREPVEDQNPDPCREKTFGFHPPLLQNCSTPVQLSEREVENMETQAFLSPSSLPIKSSSCSDSQEDEDLVVAETQSFILQTRNCQGNPLDDPTQTFDLERSDDEKNEHSSRGASFQLGLSDGSHLQCQAEVLATESTQAFLPVDRNVEAIQSNAAILTSDRTSAENAPTLEATQAFGQSEEPAICSVIPEKGGHIDLALEATQAYISELYSDSEDETDQDETENTAAEADSLACPISSTLAMAETQPMSAFEEEEIITTDKLASSVQVKSRTQTETEEGKENRAILQTDQTPFSEVLSTAETQPMDSLDDNDSFPGPRRRKAKPLQLEEEQTQPLTDSENQTMHPGICEAQGMSTSENEPCLQNEEDRNAATNTKEDKESNQDVVPGFRKRRGKLMQPEEEAQLLSSSVDTQPIVMGEDKKSDEDLIAFLDNKKLDGKIQRKTNSDVSNVEIQHLATTNDGQPERGRWSEAGTSGVTFVNKGETLQKLNEEQQAKCTDIPRTMTREETKVLNKVKSRPHEEDEEVERPRARGKKSTRKQKNTKEAECFTTERSCENNTLIKEKPKGREEEEKNVVNLGQQERQTMEKGNEDKDEREGNQGETERQHRADEAEHSKGRKI